MKRKLTKAQEDKVLLCALAILRERWRKLCRDKSLHSIRHFEADLLEVFGR